MKRKSHCGAQWEHGLASPNEVSSRGKSLSGPPRIIFTTHFTDSPKYSAYIRVYSVSDEPWLAIGLRAGVGSWLDRSVESRDLLCVGSQNFLVAFHESCILTLLKCDHCRAEWRPFKRERGTFISSTSCSRVLTFSCWVSTRDKQHGVEIDNAYEDESEWNWFTFLIQECMHLLLARKLANDSFLTPDLHHLGILQIFVVHRCTLHKQNQNSNSLQN